MLVKFRDLLENLLIGAMPFQQAVLRSSCVQPRHKALGFYGDSVGITAENAT